MFFPLIKILFFPGCSEESALLCLVEIITFFICSLFSFTRLLQTYFLVFSVNISTKRKPALTCSRLIQVLLTYKSSAHDLSTYKGSFYYYLLIFCLSGEAQEYNKGKENIKRHSFSHAAFTKAGCKSCSPLTHPRNSPNICYSGVQVLGWQNASKLISGTLDNRSDPILRDLNNILTVMFDG